MDALGFGLIAAAMWGAAALTSATAARRHGPWVTLFWMVGLGALFSVPAALLTSSPEGSASDWVWTAVTGIAMVTAGACWVLAVTSGQVSIVTPIVAADGAIAAVISVLAGERLHAALALALAVVAAGVVLVSSRRSATEHRKTSGVAVLAAVGAAAFFGLMFFAGGQVDELSPLWTTGVARLVAVALAAPLVLALARGAAVRLTRSSAPWLAATAATDVVGYLAFLEGADSSIAVASVMASQYAAVAVLGGLVFFRERLSRPQIFGIALILAGIAFVAAVEG